MHRSTPCVIGFSVVAFLLASFWVATAAQPDKAVQCDAHGEPVPEGAPIDYGQHTEGCRIDGPADLDSFTFAGTAGTSFASPSERRRRGSTRVWNCGTPPASSSSTRPVEG